MIFNSAERVTALTAAWTGERLDDGRRADAAAMIGGGRGPLPALVLQGGGLDERRYCTGSLNAKNLPRTYAGRVTIGSTRG